MRRLLSIAVVVLAAAVVAARGGMQAPEPEGEKKLIDLKSDLMGPIAPGDSVVFLVGNFAAQHNGAVITCDSAVRYSDMRIEFFGHVLINKNTTYIYGDRAEYDGELNEARVYSDIVKVVDGDATLYTYKFLFNTKENVGEFADGGVMLNRENLLESVRGYYYADTKELIAVDRVEMRNDEYELKGDSVVYNMATDNAFFFERTNIWNKDGDYLYADRGSYDKADTLYIVTRNGYILTEKQEIWSDSLHYYRAEDHVILRRDLQLDDAEHKVIAFGDYGEYWKEPGNAFLTRRPAVVSYDLSQGDSLFMRADSMYLFTINENALRRVAAAAKSRLAGAPENRFSRFRDAAPPGRGSFRRPSCCGFARKAPRSGCRFRFAGRRRRAGFAGPAGGPRFVAGAFPFPIRWPFRPSIPLDTLVGDARKAYLKEQAAKLKAAQKRRGRQGQEGKTGGDRPETPGEDDGQTAGPEGAGGAAPRCAQTQGRVETPRPPGPCRPQGQGDSGRFHGPARDRLADRPQRPGDGFAAVADVRFAGRRLAGDADSGRLGRFAHRLRRLGLSPDEGFPQCAYFPFRFPGRMRLDDGHQHRFDDSSLHRPRAVEPGQPDHLRRDGHIHREPADHARRVHRHSDDGLPSSIRSITTRWRASR